MEFKQNIQQKIKEAMLAKDQVRMETMRSIVNSLTVFEKNNPGKTVNEIEILSTMAKQRQQSIDAYATAQNEALAERERQELTIIQEFLPKRQGEGIITSYITEIVKELSAAGPKDMGKVLNAFKAKCPGQDMALVSKITKEILSKI